MRQQTFYNWLLHEVTTERLALIELYAARDKLLYMEAPPLKQQYMSLFHSTELDVMAEEMEVVLLQTKLTIIQTAINRREPIDLDAIDAKIEEISHGWLEELAKANHTAQDYPELSDEQKKTMQNQYQKITSHFHPMVNPGISHVQKLLYQKAVEAYRAQDAEAIQLIYEQLFSSSGIELKVQVKDDSEEDTSRKDYRKLSDFLSTDYKLASKLYGCFMPIEEDAVVRDAIKKYEETRQKLDAEVNDIRQGFPFNAVDKMNDPAKRDEYLAELRLRSRQYAQKKADLEQRIAALLERSVHE